MGRAVWLIQTGASSALEPRQELVQRGITLIELPNAGRWTVSQMPAHYTRAKPQGPVCWKQTKGI